jgi:hypothetical protein
VLLTILELAGVNWANLRDGSKDLMPMRKALLGFLLLAAIGCGGSNDSEMIVGSWFASAAPTWASNVGSIGTSIIIEFMSGGQYSANKVQLASATVANTEVETGTYTVSGSTLTTVPEQWTCPYSDPSYAVSIAFVGGDLQLDTSSGVISLQKTPESFDSGYQFTQGCFDSSGNFTPEPFGPAN